jgi:hypothetical protein
LLGEENVTARVKSLSPTEIYLEETLYPLPLDGRPKLVRLDTGKENVALEAFLEQEPSNPSLVVARPASPTQAVARELLTIVDRLVATGEAASPSGPPALYEIVEDRARQNAVVESLIRYGSTGVLRVDGFPAGPAVPLEVTEDGIVLQLNDASLEGPFTVELVSYNSIYSFDFDQSTRIGNAVIGRPSRMVRLRHRSFRRTEPPPGTLLEFEHPLWPGFILRKAVREISAGGLSFRVDLLEDLLYPGLQISNALLTVAGHSIHFSGEVKSLTRDPGGSHYACGIHLYPESATDEGSWFEALDDCLHSTTRIRGTWARPTWDLYARAGYFDLSGKDPPSFNRLFDAFERTSRRIEAAPQLGCQAVWPHDDRHVEAAMSMVKVYSTSWLVFQLAKVSGPTRRDVPGRVVLRDLHLRCYEHAQRDPELKWLIGIPQVRQTWSRLVHYDLPRKYLVAGEAEIVRFRAIEIAVQGPTRPPDADLEIRPGSLEESAILLEHVRRTRSPAYVDALDLTPERFQLSEIHDTWQGAGFRRMRTFFVAVSRTGVQAAAVLESADEGLHLFRLLDCVRLFSLAPGGEEAFGPLLDAARGWYRAQSKSAYVVFLEGDALPAWAHPESTDLGLADFAILSAARLPEFLEHVYEVTAPSRAAPDHAAPSSRQPSPILDVANDGRAPVSEGNRR